MVRVGKRYKDFLDGTYQESLSSLDKSKVEKRAATLKRQGYRTYITSHREPELYGIPRDRVPDGYPRIWHTVWQRR